MALSLASVAPPGEDWMSRRFRDIERRLGELESSLTRAGLLGNDVLASPVVSAVANRTVSFDLTNGSPRMLVTENVAVPAGFAVALTIVTATITALRNGADVAANLSIGAVVDPDSVDPLDQDVAVDAHGSVASTAAAKIAVTGPTVQIGAFGRAGGSGWVPGTGFASMSGLVLFLKG